MTATREPSPGAGTPPGSRFRRRQGVVGQVIDDEAVLLDIQGGEYFSLNSVASRIWELCDGTRTVDEIVAAICVEFDVAADVAVGDVGEMIDALTAANLVVRE
jgi:hypothetical protein